MEAKRLIPQQRLPPMILTKRMERKAIPNAHQEETGGKVRFITSNPGLRAPVKVHAWSYLYTKSEGSLDNKKKAKFPNVLNYKFKRV